MGLVTSPAVVAGASSPTTTIYDSTDPASAQLPSLAYEATQATEIGNQVVFAPGTSRTLSNVVVSMDSWGCGTSGGWSTNDCVTSPGATFAQPITLNLYAANADNSPGALITSVTQTVNLSYRPSADATNCTGANAGKWFNAANSTCYNGIVTNATLNLGDITVPDKVIYGVEIRTSDYGDPAIGGPLGDATACHASSTGCPYDSLNVALSLDPSNVTVGSNAVTNALYWNTGYGPNYCDGGASATGTFRLDAGCWGDAPPYTSSPYDVPAVQFNAATICTTTCYVATTGNDTNAGTSDSPFATIQHAVNTVASGGTVNVAAGTYNENVLINQPVNLLGANAGVAGTSARGAESIISTNNVTGNDDTVEVSSAGVTVSGFTLQQTAQVTCAFCGAYGVQVDATASGATITDNVITGMSVSGSSPRTLNPIGVNIGASGSTSPNNVTVSKNLIENITSTGTQHTSALGIEVGPSSATGVGTGLIITGNHITGVSDAGWGGYGIITVRATSGTQITGNTIDTISGFGWARGIGLEATTTNPTVSNNDISGVTSPATAAGSASDLYVDPTDSGASSTSILDNSLTGSSAVALLNAGTATVTATNNWWGCAAGANAAGCSTTSGPVNSTPWIVSYTPDPAKAGQPGFWPTAITSSSAPAFTSANSAVFHVGVAGSFTVTASGAPAPTLSESGALPSGITFNPATGVFSGTPTSASSSNVTLSAATTGYPTATQPFNLVVSSNTAAITSASSVQVTAAKPKVNFTITTSGSPTALVTAPGLPSWLHLTAGAGKKAGTAKLTGTAPAGGGNFVISIHANNGQYADTVQSFTIHELAIYSSSTASFSKSGPATQSFTITTTGGGGSVSLSATLGAQLSGLTFHDNGNGTATISGQPASTDKTHIVKVTATSLGKSTTQLLAVGINS